MLLVSAPTCVPIRLFVVMLHWYGRLLIESTLKSSEASAGPGATAWYTS